MLSALFDQTWGWIIAGVILVGLEIIVPGAFLLWIGMGAVSVGVVLSLLPGIALGWQLLIFAFGMLGWLLFGVWLQRLGRANAAEPYLNRELEQMVGQAYVALHDFEAGRGRIKVRDSSFAAVSDHPVREAQLVRVTEIVDGKPKVAPAG